MKKKKKIVKLLSIMLCIIIFSLGLISYSSKILNPFIGLNGIFKLTTGHQTVEKISDDPLRYISRSYEDFTTYMEKEGYIVDQLGRGFSLKKENETITLTSEGFIGMYEIFSAPN
ncbi:hypothetical protein [Terrisporobacter petrolearius]|uniref:hypothetical protein n=1 Tax=Terrisporobacter petrolearius TaxID=1460447 RepID=UPI003B00A099